MAYSNQYNKKRQHGKQRKKQRFILLRHGESTANVDNDVYHKLQDHLIPLTEKGVEQASKAAENLHFELANHEPEEEEPEFYKFYCSTHLRTVQTLDVIKDKYGIGEVTYDPRLVEQYWGSPESQPSLEDFKKHGMFHYKPPGGESGLDVYVRVRSFLQDLPNDGNINIIISHGMTIQIFKMILNEWTPEQMADEKFAKNCEITNLERWI